MQHAADLLTDGRRSTWPPNAIACGAAYFHPRPISDAFAPTPRRLDAPRAAMWRRDPSAWSATPTCSRRSPTARLADVAASLMADSLERLRAFADGVKRDGFTDVVLLGMGGSSLAPEVLRADRRHGARLAAVPHARLDGSRRDPRGRHDARADALSAGEQVGHDDRAEHARGAFPPHAGRRRHHAMGGSFRRDHRRRHRARAARARRGVSRRLHQPVGHRRPLLGAVVLRPGAGRADGTGHRGARSAGGSRCWRRPAEAPATRDNPAVALGLLARRRRARRPRQADAAPAAGTGAVRPLGRTARGGEHREAGRRHRADCRRTLGDRPRVRRRSRCSSSSRPGATARSTRTRSSSKPARRTRRRRSTGTSRPRSARSSSAGRSRRRSPGALLEINPFDEPNVQQAKDATTTLLDAYKSKGALPARGARPDARRRHHADREPAARERLGRARTRRAAHAAAAGDYFALLAYVGPDAELADELARFRNAVRDRTLRRRCSATGRGICIRPASCTRAVRTPASSS